MPIRHVNPSIRLVLLFVLCLSPFSALGQGTTAFTYQGRLTDGANPANGSFDLQFTLFDAVSGGAQQGSAVVRPSVTVTNGVFSVQLDFGTVPFTTTGTRFLEIGVRPGGSGGGFTILSPRQQVTPTPYAIKSLSADSATTATNATQLGGQPAANFVQTNDPRLTDARNPLPGSPNYIQNGTAQQASSNFNVSGTGTAGIFNAATQYNIGGNRVLSVAGTQNVFSGVGAGVGNTTGANNSFFGFSSGAGNSTGSFNAFFGWNAGQNNNANSNSFFGNSAGRQNTTGSRNSIFGTDSGALNTTGSNNSFFGTAAGAANTTGGGNAFFGSDSGQSNTTGESNAFFGNSSGLSNTIGGNNAFFGNSSGFSNTIGGNNAFFGNSSGFSNTTGGNNAFFGNGSGQNNTIGTDNAVFGMNALINNLTGIQNTVVGSGAGFSNTTGGNNTFIGFNAGSGALANLNFATAIGANAQVEQSNTIILGRTGGLDNVGINTTTPTDRLQVNGNVRATAFIQSSDARYKTDIRTIEDALAALLKLRGVTFAWREDAHVDGTAGRQVGFIAQEVEEVLPEVVTTAKDGYKAVSYTNVVPLLVEAIKDQQKEIEAQQRQIDDLLKIVRSLSPQADLERESPPRKELRCSIPILRPAIRRTKATIRRNRPTAAK